MLQNSSRSVLFPLTQLMRVAHPPRSKWNVFSRTASLTFPRLHLMITLSPLTNLSEGLFEDAVKATVLLPHKANVLQYI